MRQLPVLDDLLEDDDSIEEYVKYGQLINEQTKGGLKVPTNPPEYFTYFCYMAFVLQHEFQPTCQKNYIEFFVEINRYTEVLPRNNKNRIAGFSQIFS